MNPILKDTIREVNKTKGRFFSIMGIILVGVAFFTGIYATAPDMKYSVDAYFDAYNLMDLRIVSNLGLQKEDIEEIQKVEGVEGVYGAHTKEFITQIGDESYVAKVSTYNDKALNDESTSYINRFVLVEGRFPENKSEVLGEKSHMVSSGIQLDDVLTFTTGTDEDINQILYDTEVTVVGLIETPYYLSHEKGTSRIGNGEIQSFVYMDERNFKTEYYDEAFVRIEGATDYNSYDEEYFDYIQPVVNELESIGYVQSEIRYNSIIDEVQAELEEAKQAYEEGKKTYEEEIAKAEEEIADSEDEILLGTASLESAQLLLTSEIASAKSQIETLEKQLDSVEELYQTYKAEYEETNAQIIAEKKELEKSKKKLETQLVEKEVEAEPFYKRLAEIEVEIQQIQSLIAENPDDIVNNIEYQKQILELQNEQILILSNTIFQDITKLETEIQRINTQITLIDDSLKIGYAAVEAYEVQQEELSNQIVAAKEKIKEEETTKQAEIDNGWEELEKGKIELEEGILKLEEERIKGEKELEDGAEKIVKAENEVSLIEDGKWYVLDRTAHYSYRDYEGAADRMANIAVVFPIFFFLVAALVCLTTMTRMVDEQRLQMGTLKALGYRNGTIASKYLIYASTASFMGSIVGFLIGVHVLPYVIYNVWRLMYIVPDIQFTPQYTLGIVSVGVSILVTAGATWAACYKEVIAHPSSLMRPIAPKNGKKVLLERIPLLWKHMSFTMKVTVRNIFRYKKRMIMTLIGIAGCTSLVVSGFGIKDSISDISDIQFQEIFQYDGLLTFDAAETLEDETKEAFNQELIENPYITESILVNMNNIELQDIDGEKTISLVVAQTATQLDGFVDLRNRIQQESLTIPSDGVLISEKIANDRNLHVGDTVTIVNQDQLSGQVEISGVIENYIGHYMYMQAQLYEETFRVKPELNTIMFHINHTENEAIVAEELLEDDSVLSVTFHSGFQEHFSNMIESLNIIVVVLVVCAALLAFIVLYNLTNVNISERQREIATLKVLGFYREEIRRYVYYENIFLTIFGALLGLGLGKVLHLLIMVVVEMDDIMFGRTIEWKSYIISLGITIIFAVIVNKVMEGKLRKIEMVESLKSIE